VETLEEYSKEETGRLLDGERLLNEVAIMRRWSYDLDDPGEVRQFKSLMWKLRTGRHPSNLQVDSVRLSGKRYVYRVKDILGLEHGLMEWGQTLQD
jgi:hypothetical protein